MQGGCWGTKLVESSIGYTTIGELRAPPDTVSATFTYGRRADSEIGVAARASRGQWEGSGSFHIANAHGTQVDQDAVGGEHILVTGRFNYDRFEYQCGPGKREKVVPREWMGDVQPQPTSVRGCAGVPEGRMGHYGPRSKFTRDSEKAVRWEGAVSVFGASLTGRSGYSQYVRGHWVFGSVGDHWLCGDDGPPREARHIFAGTSA